MRGSPDAGDGQERGRPPICEQNLLVPEGQLADAEGNADGEVDHGPDATGLAAGRGAEGDSDVGKVQGMHVPE